MGCAQSKNRNEEGSSSQAGGNDGEKVPDTTTDIHKEVKKGGYANENFIFENEGKITDFYQFDDKKDELGEGTYGTVCKARQLKRERIPSTSNGAGNDHADGDDAKMITTVLDRKVAVKYYYF